MTKNIKLNKYYFTLEKKTFFWENKADLITFPHVNNHILDTYFLGDCLKLNKHFPTCHSHRLHV